MTADPKTDTDKPESRMDWSAIQRRLERAHAALEQKTAPAAEEKKHILKARARALAREPDAGRTGLDQIAVVEFLVAGERYAVESAYVREVCRLIELTPLPGTPAFVLGIISVRGQIVSVIDPKRFFDLPQKGLTDLNKVILISDGTMEFGLLADAVLGEGRVFVKELQPSLPTLTGLRAEFLIGVSSDHLVVLDAKKLLSDPGMIVNAKEE